MRVLWSQPMNSSPVPGLGIRVVPLGPSLGHLNAPPSANFLVLPTALSCSHSFVGASYSSSYLVSGLFLPLKKHQVQDAFEPLATGVCLLI